MKPCRCARMLIGVLLVFSGCNRKGAPISQGRPELHPRIEARDAESEGTDSKDSEGQQPESAPQKKEDPPRDESQQVSRFNQSIASLREELAREFKYRAVPEWKGLKFIFLPRPLDLQKYGYQGFDREKDKFDHPSYEECAGQIATVTEIEARTDVGYDITFAMDHNGRTYSAFVLDDSGSIHGVAPLADIQKALAKWRGKLLWVNTRRLGTYDPKTGKSGETRIAKFQPVTVIDVVPGWYSHSPVRFILRTAGGEEGFIDCSLSGTNVAEILRDSSQFHESFLIEDPRQVFSSWHDSVWQCVQEAKVCIGMTAQQAKMSWGAPKRVSRTVTASGTREQWVYGSGSYLYFEHGALTGIQN